MDQMHDKLLSALEKSPEEIHKNRLLHYSEKLKSLKHLSEIQQVREINHYFNSFFQEYDSSIWNKREYWATPREFLNQGGGDCEDFVIIKYFSLIKLGIPADRLQMALVNVKGNRQRHMVLHYLKKGTKTPYVLDNLSFRILPLNQRTDLEPIYTFNSESFQIFKRSHRQQKDKYTLLNKLDDLLIRVQKDKLDSPKMLALMEKSF
jgi:predicted transglutaminase-like cysteine proteinase